MHLAEILITMVSGGAIIARNPTIGTFLLKASAPSPFLSAPISRLNVQELIARDLICATATTQDGMEIYLLTAEGRRRARTISRSVAAPDCAGA
jgi:hypothetical protein